jgi:hypothetical protein
MKKLNKILLMEKLSTSQFYLFETLERLHKSEEFYMGYRVLPVTKALFR